MSADHRTQVDELLAGYRRSREQLAEIQQELAAVTESATSTDGLVTARVGAQGQLTELVLADAVYRRYQPAELAALVTSTVAAAATRAGRRAAGLLAPVLPVDADDAAMPEEGRANTEASVQPASNRPDRPAPLAPAGPSAPAKRRPRRMREDGDQEESFEETSWLSSVRPKGELP